MSTPRICDTRDCNRIFSENEQGWSSAPVTISKRDDKGNVRNISIQLDYCPQCTAAMTGEGIPGNNRGEPRVPPVRGRYDERYTRQLEQEAGITREDRPTFP